MKIIKSKSNFNLLVIKSDLKMKTIHSISQKEKNKKAKSWYNIFSHDFYDILHYDDLEFWSNISDGLKKPHQNRNFINDMTEFSWLGHISAKKKRPMLWYFDNSYLFFMWVLQWTPLPGAMRKLYIVQEP